MAIIHVDGKQFEVDPADNLLQACLSRGLDLPYFCWHPALGSVGACRQCAVKIYRDENDKVGRLVMSCMTPATDNTRISMADPESKEFREAIISLMMTNHPHDCPVCEEGGHCHLQDMTVMTGHYRRQYHFTKRTHLNQDLGPFIAHEMNRCIACYRCTRFYNDYAGGTDFGVFGSAAHVYFGRVQSGTLQSEFSGNLTEICPTGVFTDKTHSEHYARKWDMQFAPSICAGCAVGCNISPGERYGEVRRIENRYHGELNGYFLCDRGRFGYGYVNRKDRPRKPMLKRDGALASVEVADALARVRQLLAAGKPVVGIGSPRASLEANFRLRDLVGASAFSSGMTRHDAELTDAVLRVLRDGPVSAATILRDRPGRCGARARRRRAGHGTARRAGVASGRARQIAGNDAREEGAGLAGRVRRRHRAARAQSDLRGNARGNQFRRHRETLGACLRRRQSRTSVSPCANAIDGAASRCRRRRGRCGDCCRVAKPRSAR